MRADTPAAVRRSSQLVEGLGLTIAIAIVYFVSAHLGTFWTTAGRESSPIFPGTGAALAALILFGRQYWPAVLLGRLLAFALAASTRSIWLLLAVASANALAAWLGAFLLERVAQFDRRLTRLSDVLWLALAGGVVGAFAGASVGVAGMHLAGEITGSQFAGTWLRWWMGSIGGVLVVTPLALAWGAGDPLPRRPAWWLHLGAAVLVTTLVSIVVFFGSRAALAHTWLVFPVLLWSSLAFGVRGATLALLPATVVGVAGTTAGAGALYLGLEPGVRSVLLQQFVTAASFTSLVLAVVADERRGRQALRDREQRLHLALAAARSFGFDYEPSIDRVTRTSECAEILGLPPEVATRDSATHYETYIHEEDRTRWREALHRLAPAAPRCQMSYRFVRPDGSTICLEETWTAEFDADGGLTRVVGVAIDITERRHVEREREMSLERERAARLEAERATLLRDEFLGTVSHELRTPLNAILGWAQILQSGPRTPDALQSGLATIARNARLQAQLIDDLLDLSRMSAGQLRLDAAPVDLSLVLRDAVLAVKPAADAKGLTLHQDASAPGTIVSGDADRLQQVCWNLLVNAVKFTPAGGEVHAALERHGDDVFLHITDTGQGIAADFLPFVFDRFRQGDGSTTRRHSGLGIGLALVRQLVELHGGRVDATSRGEGLGATFTVRLPALRDSAPPRSEPTAKGEVTMPDAAALTVLVVDDDADSREVAARMLEGTGARVLTASGASEGLALLRARRPDVLVADIGMPGMDGYALIKAVRQLSSHEGADTPAAAMTALAREEDRQRALDAGYQAHLAKPVSREDLLATVSRLHQPPRRG
jgi:PAS domain S-box-containing protein